jgi:hypothetical protein
MGYLALAGHPVEAHVPFRFQIRYGKRAHLYMFYLA